jgi:hypothetical protein
MLSLSVAAYIILKGWHIIKYKPVHRKVFIYRSLIPTLWTTVWQQQITKNAQNVVLCFYTMCLINACIQKLQASQGTVEDCLFGKCWKHPNNGIVLKGFYFMIIHFLNHTIVITEELFAILILNKRFFKTYTIFKLIYFLHPILCTIPYLLKHLFQSLCSFGVKISKFRKYL